MTLKRSLSHAFGMFLYATETLVKEVKKPLNCMRSPWLEAQAQLFKMGVMWHYGWNLPGKTGVNEKKNWGVGGKDLNKPCIALGLGFSEAPRTGLSLLQLVTAELSASLGAVSSQGWMLHFSFFWAGFPPTSYSAWAAYCFPAVHGGFLVHVQHPSFYSWTAEIITIKNPQPLNPTAKHFLEKFADLLKSKHSPKVGWWNFDKAQADSCPNDLVAPAQQPRKGDARSPPGDHACHELCGSSSKEIWGLHHILALWSNLNSFLTTVLQRLVLVWVQLRTGLFGCDPLWIHFLFIGGKTPVVWSAFALTCCINFSFCVGRKSWRSRVEHGHLGIPHHDCTMLITPPVSGAFAGNSPNPVCI